MVIEIPPLSNKKSWGRNKRILVYRRRYGPAADYILRQKKINGGKYLPWDKTWLNIEGRCSNRKVHKWEYYGGRGIKNLLTRTDLRDTFYRDKAYLMKQPSINRIDPDKDYTLPNIEWVEFDWNRTHRRCVKHISRPLTKKLT